MKKILLIVIILYIMTSCNEKIFTGDVNCDECYTDKPGNADLVINLTINNKFKAVPVTVYYDDVEDNKIVVADTAFNTPYYLYVPVNRRYSVKAEYRDDLEVIYAVDGTNLKVLSVADACEVSCYVIENENIDVRLRREFQ